MKKKDVFKRWRKRSLKFKIFAGILIALLLIAGPFGLIAVILSFFNGFDFTKVWNSGLFYSLWGLAELGIIIYALFEYRTLGSRRVKKANADLEDSHFMSDAEISKDSSFTVTEFSKLGNVKDGILIKAERHGDKMHVVLADPIHTGIVATTGTGKTTAYVSPFIEIVSRTSTKPCMVISDPKGELYGRHVNTLKKQGYNVYEIDLTMTYKSTLWNPFNDVIRKTERMSAPIERVKNKYVWAGRTYTTYEDAERERKEFSVRLKDEIATDLLDLIYTACPVEAAQDKSWQQGARDLIYGMALRMWEDLRDGYLPKEKFNLYNLWWNLTTYGKPNPDSGMCDILNEYIQDCADDVSKAEGMANTVLVSQDRTLTSYLGSVNQYLHWMADGGVQQLTSGNEIEFGQWDEAPNVLFIKVPDMKEGRHGLVSLMLLQIYKALDEKGTMNQETGETPDKALKRHCYFLMDEFGSLPPIRNFDNIVKIARSLGVLLMPVLQDYAQLVKVYGEHPSNTIKNNLNIKIFMGTNDDKTRNEISEGCGKHKAKSVSYNENKDMSVTTSAQSIPLIYPSELSKLNEPKNGIFGNAIALVAGSYPIQSHTTPYFKAKDIFGIDDTPVIKKEFMFFNELENRYDITKLIYLYRILFGDETEEALAKPSGGVEGQSEKYEPKKESAESGLTAQERLTAQVLKEIARLNGKIGDDDFLKLTLASMSNKIAILDSLAEAATGSGNLLLAMEIESIISNIKRFLEHPAVAE